MFDYCDTCKNHICNICNTRIALEDEVEELRELLKESLSVYDMIAMPCSSVDDLERRVREALGEKK